MNPVNPNPITSNQSLIIKGVKLNNMFNGVYTASTWRIIDVKTPSSGEEKSFHYENLKYITSSDEFKFVISNIEDYNYSKKFIKTNLFNSKSIINFSPAHNSIEYSKLAELILKDSLNVRLNLQLHKLIWPGSEEDKIILDF